MTCIHHPDTPAVYVCDGCGKKFCEECITVRSFGSTQVELCPDCGQHLYPYTPPREAKRGLKQRLGGWLKRSGEPPEVPRQRRLLEQARGLRTMHHYPQALEAYEQALALVPDFGLALEGRFSLLMEMLRKEEAHRAGVAYMQHLLQLRDMNGVIDVFRQLQNLNESASFDPEMLWRVAKELQARDAMMEAVKAYKKIAVHTPHHPRAPEALAEAAELLQRDLGKPKVARSFYLQLAKSYPRHALAAQAQRALARLAEDEPGG